MNLLRDYQKKAIEDIRYHFRRGKKRVLLVSPTGSGKTIIACSMIEASKKNHNSSLFVAHRRGLVMQCSGKLADFEVPHGVIMAGKSPNMFADVQVGSIQTFTSRVDREDFIKFIENII